MKLKKLLGMVICVAMVVLGAMSMVASADEYVAHFNKSGEQFTTLQAAIDKIVDVTTEEHIVLDADITENVVLDGSYIYKIYLNKHTLNGQIKIERGALTLHGCSTIHQGRGAVTGGIHCISTTPNSAHVYIDTVDISNTSGDAIVMESSSLDLQLISDVTVNGNVIVKNGEFIVADDAENLVNGTITKENPGTVSLVGGCYTEDPSALLGNTQKAVYDDVNEVWKLETVTPATTIEDFAKDGEGAYLISTADELVVFHNELSAGGASTFEGKVFKLTNTIDLTGKVFVTTGDKNNRFGGTFDGQGNTLKNLVVDGEGRSYAGFFGSLGVNGTVKNVKVENASVTGNSYVGVLIGQSRSSSLVENCSVTGEIEVDATGSYVAGIIGHMQSANGIKNCSVTGKGTISGGAQVGGLVGTVSNSGTVEANTVSGIAIEGNAGVGGIVGFLLPNATEVSGNKVEDIEIDGNSGTGLVIGEILTNSNTVTVDNNTATESTINGEESNIAYGVIDSEKIVAIVNGTPYGTLDPAIAAADGAKITLVADAALNTKLSNKIINIDLNSYTMFVNVGANYIIGANSISNGTVDISNASSSQNIFGLAQYATPATTLTMDKVNFVGDGFNSGYAVFEIGNSGADVALTITNSTIDLKNDNASQGGFVKGYGVNCVLTIDNTKVNLDNTDMFNVNVSANITDSEFVITNLSDTAFRNLGGTIDNTVISVTNSGNGIRNSSAGYNLSVVNGSSIKISGSTNTEAGKIGDLVLAAGNTVAVDTTSELLVETSAIANPEDVSGNVVSKADTVYIQYKKTDIDGTTDTLEGADTYEIILAGGSAEKINELASADLTFNFVGTPYTGAAMTYTVTPADGVTLSQIGDRYMFNYNGVDKYEETGAAIVIGTIEVSGYGKYYLGTKNVDTNAVYATEIRDNIVDGFEAAGDLVINDNAAFDDMEGYYGDIEIVVPTRELTINVDFPNTIENNAYSYQQMKVTVSGGDLDEALVIELGDDYTIDLSAYTDKTGCAATAVFADGAYKVTLTKLLTKDVAYNVEVSGAGYRTARYTVTMQGEDTDGKVLNFWNNVKDNALEVEEGKATSAKTVTYLAGDIVKDSLINIYDLSAVVSYFGETMSTDEYNAYAKYDLNRDGKIDSKDVAYVLVSWGK